MATITIGGVTYDLPEMNFLAIERAWPYVEEASSTLDPMKGPSAAIAVFAAAMMEAEDFDKSRFGVPEDVTSDVRIHIGVTQFLKKKLKGSELSRVKDAMFAMLEEAGLEVTEGEALKSLGEALMSLSEETAQDTSQSSLQQDAKGDLGTS